MGARIKDVKAREIFAAARGVLSLEVTVTTDDGATGVSTPETGVSTGSHEMKFVIDGGERYGGLGVRKAAENVNSIIAPALIGMDVTKQLEIDRQMIELDGTKDKSRLGANAIVGVSLAAIKAAANSSNLPLYRYIGGANAVVLPIPIVGVGTGGRYRDPGASRWLKPSYEFCAYGAGSFSEALHISWQLSQEYRRILKSRYGDKYQAVYGPTTSLAGVITDDRELLDVMTEAIQNKGQTGKVGLYFDCAADCYYEPSIDKYVGLFRPGERTRDEQMALLKDLIETYPIISIEDPFHENDFESHALAVKELGIEIVGDDLFTTNADRVRQAVEIGAASSMVLKITQVGTVSEAMSACRLCQSHGYNVHPCGSRGDRDSIGDFAVGLNAGQIRGVSNNRMIEIEEDLGSNFVWLGKNAYTGWRNRQ